MTHAVFAYGTLLFAEVMEIVAGARIEAQPARLPGWERRSLHGAVYPGVFASPGAVTTGVLYDAVSDATLARLDAFEGAEYERRVLPVETRAGARDAFTYVIQGAQRGLLAERAWDPESFRTQHLARFLEGLR